MTAYAIFHLLGPMQGWGGIAVGETRAGEHHPTKSGVLGLVAAALGITREEENAHQQLHRDLGFAVRILHGGEPLRDYHTAQVPGERRGIHHTTRAAELAQPKLNTILSTREYRVDAWYAVALWARGDMDLQKIITAFKHPSFVLYLGRKSCPPALPVVPRLIEADNLGRAFHEFMAQEADLLPKPYKDPTKWEKAVYYEGEGEGIAFRGATPRYDLPHARRSWTFLPRQESHGRLSPDDKEEP